MIPLFVLHLFRFLASRQDVLLTLLMICTNMCAWVMVSYRNLLKYKIVMLVHNFKYCVRCREISYPLNYFMTTSSNIYVFSKKLSLFIAQSFFDDCITYIPRERFFACNCKGLVWDAGKSNMINCLNNIR